MAAMNSPHRPIARPDARSSSRSGRPSVQRPHSSPSPFSPERLEQLDADDDAGRRPGRDTAAWRGAGIAERQGHPHRVRRSAVPWLPCLHRELLPDASSARTSGPARSTTEFRGFPFIGSDSVRGSAPPGRSRAEQALEPPGGDVPQPGTREQRLDDRRPRPPARGADPGLDVDEALRRLRAARGSRSEADAAERRGPRVSRARRRSSSRVGRPAVSLSSSRSVEQHARGARRRARGVNDRTLRVGRRGVALGGRCVAGYLTWVHYDEAAARLRRRRRLRDRPAVALRGDRGNSGRAARTRRLHGRRSPSSLRDTLDRAARGRDARLRRTALQRLPAGVAAVRHRRGVRLVLATMS